jgi:hypothetical protein
MPRYYANGVHKDTGALMPTIFVSAVNETEARAMVMEQGMIPDHITPMRPLLKDASAWGFMGPALLAGFFFLLLSSLVLGGLPGAAIGTLLAWLKVVDASIGVAAGVGLGAGTTIAVIVWIILIIRPNRKTKS